jgi:hypothetical protein
VNRLHLDNVDCLERAAAELAVETQESKSSLKMPTEKTEQAIFDETSLILINESLKLDDTQ